MKELLFGFFDYFHQYGDTFPKVMFAALVVLLITAIITRSWIGILNLMDRRHRHPIMTVKIQSKENFNTVNSRDIEELVTEKMDEIWQRLNEIDAKDDDAVFYVTVRHMGKSKVFDYSYDEIYDFYDKRRYLPSRFTDQAG